MKKIYINILVIEAFILVIKHYLHQLESQERWIDVLTPLSPLPITPFELLGTELPLDRPFVLKVFNRQQERIRIEIKPAGAIYSLVEVCMDWPGRPYISQGLEEHLRHTFPMFPTTLDESGQSTPEALPDPASDKTPTRILPPHTKRILPEKPPIPNTNGYIWDDFFDWCYRQPRKITVDEMSTMTGKGKRTVEREKSNYESQYGKQAIPNDKSKFST